METRDDTRRKLMAYVPLTKFLALFLGEKCEVVLHDTNNVEKSIIAIENGHISGRKVGDPLKNLGRFFKNDRHLKADFIKTHAVINSRGQKLKSASYFIKDENRELMGMLCLNMDVTRYEEIKGLMDGYVLSSELNFNAGPDKEDGEPFEEGHSIEDLTHSIIKETILGVDVPPARMTPEEKMDVVERLNDRGVFLLRGAISEVAKLLEASENTIYRYLSRLSDQKK